MIRHRARWLLATLLCLALWPAAAHGQSSDLDAAYNRFVDLCAQGRYEQAIPFAKKTLSLGEQKFGHHHPTTAIFVNNLAQVYSAQGRYNEAEPLYERSLAIRETALGPEHPDVATSLNNLALLYQTQGRYTEAEPLYQRSLAILEKVFGPQRPVLL